MNKLIEICIPTYNRLQEVTRLVSALSSEIEMFNLESFIGISVYNNSQDKESVEVLNKVKNNFTHVLHNDRNIGAAANAVQCMQKATGEYVWVFGDDDLPCFGVLKKLADFLLANETDLLYLDAKWQYGRLPKASGVEAQANFVKMDRNVFCAWRGDKITFISSIVYNRKSYEKFGANYENYKHTFLPQLEVYLTILNHQDCRIAAITARVINATGGASGGYSLINVFNYEVSRILREKIEVGNIRDVLVRKHVKLLLRMILGIKRGRFGDFSCGYIAQTTDDGLIQNAKMEKIVNENIFFTILRYVFS